MNKILCFIGKSGNGKTTIADYLELFYELHQIKSYTTRLARGKYDTSHTFVNQEEFDAIRNDLVAYTYFNGFEYGATSQQIDTHEIYVVDWIGFAELKEKYKGTRQIISIYFDVDIIRSIYRMFKRHDNINKIISRLINDYKMFKGVKSRCDYVVINNNLDKCVKEIWKIWTMKVEGDN